MRNAIYRPDIRRKTAVTRDAQHPHSIREPQQQSPHRRHVATIAHGRRLETKSYQSDILISASMPRGGSERSSARGTAPLISGLARFVWGGQTVGARSTDQGGKGLRPAVDKAEVEVKESGAESPLSLHFPLIAARVGPKELELRRPPAYASRTRCSQHLRPRSRRSSCPRCR